MIIFGKRKPKNQREEKSKARAADCKIGFVVCNACMGLGGITGCQRCHGDGWFKIEVDEQ